MKTAQIVAPIAAALLVVLSAPATPPARPAQAPAQSDQPKRPERRDRQAPPARPGSDMTVAPPASPSLRPVAPVQQSNVDGDAPSVENSVLRIEPAVVRLGSMPVGDKRSGFVTLHNLTDRPLRIERVMPACGCTTAPAPTDPIPARGSVELPVTLSGGARQGVNLDKRVTVVPEGHAPVIFRVQANVAEFIRIEPNLLIRDDDREESGRVTLTAMDETPFRILAIRPAIVDGLLDSAEVSHTFLVDWERWESANSPIRIDVTIDHPEMQLVSLLVRRTQRSLEEARARGENVHPARRGAEAGRDAASEARRPPADSREVTLLIAGAKRDNIDALEAALRLDADLDAAEGATGRTALHWAAAEGHLDFVQALLDNGATADVADRVGRTALFAAAETGRDEIVRTLIERGADVNRADRRRATPLLLAANVGTAESVALLLGAGADASHVDSNRWTPLHWAAGNGDPRAVMLLLEAGADPNAVERTTGDTPLVRAARTGRLESLEILLGHRDIEIDKTNRLGFTSLHLAAAKGDPARIRLLLERGADAKLKCRRGWTALEYAQNRLDDERDTAVAAFGD